MLLKQADGPLLLPYRATMQGYMAKPFFENVSNTSLPYRATMQDRVAKSFL